MTLEDRLRAVVRDAGDAPDLRPDLVERIMADLPERTAGRRRPTGAAILLLAALVSAILAAAWIGITGGGLGPPAATAPGTSSARASTPSTGNAPYQLAEDAGPARTISTPADCAFLADDWLRQLCSLTLIADWRAIPVAPFTQNEGPDPGVWAAVSRAQIDGDPAFCLDGLGRTYDSLGHIGGSAPPPNTTPAPVHPIAECLRGLRSTADARTFVMEDRGPPVTNGTVLTSGPVVRFTVSSDAATRAAQGVAPAFDPAAGCFAVSWALCDQVLDLATAALSDRQAMISELGVVGQMVVGCPGFASSSPLPSPCPPPSGGTWIGGVIAGGGGTLPQVVVAFDIADVGGQISLVEVPYHR